MSKFCHKCGSRLNDADVFCEICGEKQVVLESAVVVEEQPSSVIQPIVEQMAETEPEQGIAEVPTEIQPKATPKKPSKYFWVGIGGAIAAVVLIVVLAIVFAGAPYDRVVADYFDFTYNGVAEKIEWLAPEEYWEYMDKEEDVTIDDVIEVYESYIYDARMDAYKEEYGKNLDFSYKIVGEKELSQRKLKNVQEGLKENYDIAKRTVTQAYSLDVEVTIDGSKDTDTEEVEIIVVKINKDWYIVDSYGNIGFYSIFD